MTLLHAIPLAGGLPTPLRFRLWPNALAHSFAVLGGH